MYGLRAARHVRMELGDRGHEEFAARVDGRRTGRRGPRTADVRDTPVLHDHRLVGEDGLAIHRDHRDVREDEWCLLRPRGRGDANGEEEQNGCKCWTHRDLREGLKRRQPSYAPVSLAALDELRVPEN